MICTRRISIETAIVGGATVLLRSRSTGKTFRATRLLEEIGVSVDGASWYAVWASGPAQVKAGGDHLTHRGTVDYAIATDGILRANGGADGDPIPDDLAHLLHGREALERIAKAAR